LCAKSGLSYIHIPKEGHQSGKAEILVMTHGYGGGKALYARSIVSLRKHFEIYAVDWSGMGASLRSARWLFADAEDASRMLVESLEVWRKERGIEKMVLLGHSFGGYMNTIYTLKYPGAVSRLILASPVGIPEPQADAMTRFPRFLRSLWNFKLSAQFIGKLLGPFEKFLVTTMITRRFQENFPWGMSATAEYIFHINASPIAGELALMVMFQVGAFARKPLIRQMSSLRIPVTFIYGEHDWMDTEAGESACVSLRSTGNIDTRLFLLKGAGHQLFIQQPDTFVKVVALSSGVVPKTEFNNDEFQYDEDAMVQEF